MDKTTKKAAKGKRTSLIVPADVYAALWTVAKDEGRSVSGQIVYMVRQALNRDGSRKTGTGACA